MLDMSKAFDCVSHELLLLELQSCGIGGAALVWFASYLHGRISRVQTSHAPPGEELEATRGVPQGSVLGPLLFSLYVRTLPSVLRNSLLSICGWYHTTLYMSLTEIDPEFVVDALKEDVARVQSYLSERGLVLNHSKTEFLFLHKRTQTVARPTLNLNDGAIIRPATSVRYLGVVIDQHLIFHNKLLPYSARLRLNSRPSGECAICSLVVLVVLSIYALFNLYWSMGATRMSTVSSSMNMTS